MFYERVMMVSPTTIVGHSAQREVYSSTDHYLLFSTAQETTYRKTGKQMSALRDAKAALLLLTLDHVAVSCDD